MPPSRNPGIPSQSWSLSYSNRGYQSNRSETPSFVDGNKDGFLSLEEYQRIPGADPKRFARADRNKDGKLSMDEFLKSISQDFDAADTNDDGVLEDEEVKAWIAH